ncbi:MAG: CHASE domain-containing protein, partial [Opitutae bacterium]
MKTDRRGIWLSLAVLLAGLEITTLITRRVQRLVEETRWQDFEFSCSEIEGKIMERLSFCETILRSGAAVSAQAGGMSRENWHEFVKQQDLDRRAPGIQGIGFALLIPPADLADHVRQTRAAGFPAYQVRPEGDRPLYSAIIYLEPFTNRNLRAFGYDMLSESARRAAMERARDQNATALSGKVTLVQENDQNVQAGTLMYVPVYRRGLPLLTVDERRAALIGWAYSPYRMTDLMRGIMKGRDDSQWQNIHLAIYDGEAANPQTLLFSSMPDPASGEASSRELTLRHRIVAAGRPWSLHFMSHTPDNGLWFNRNAGLAALGGTSTSLFLAGLLFALFSTRSLARQLADRLTVELQASEEKFRAIADYTIDLELWFNGAGHILWVSPSVERITGYTPAEVLVRPEFMGTIMTPLAGNATSLAALREGITRGTTGLNLEFQCRHKSGAPIWLGFSWQPIFNREGTPLGLRANGRDITA